MNSIQVVEKRKIAVAIGTDLAKDYWDVVTYNADNKICFTKANMLYPKLMEWLANCNPAVVLMESCKDSHVRARDIAVLGHDTRLIKGADVKALRNVRLKNDIRDADFIAKLYYVPGTISGPPTLVKQDVKVSTSQAVREGECALAVAAGRTYLSELARLNSENEARPWTRENDGKKPSWSASYYQVMRSQIKQILFMREAHPPISQGCRDSIRNSKPTMNFRKRQCQIKYDASVCNWTGMAVWRRR